MRKVFLCLALCIATHCANAAPQTLRLAYVAPVSVWGFAADHYAQVVAARSEQALQVTSFGGGALGSVAQNFGGLRNGQIDMAILDTIALALAPGARDLNALGAPYVFADSAHFRAYMSSQVFAEMMKPVEEQAGFVYLGLLCERAPRQLTTRSKPVHSPQDLRGLRIRVPEIATSVEVFKAWGASPTPIPASDLYMALKSGLVDGQDNGFDAIVGARLHEVQGFATRLDSVRSGLALIISRQKWDTLSADQRKALLASVVETERWATPIMLATAAASVETLRRSGMQIAEPDLTPFKVLAEEATERLEGQLWSKGVIQKIRSTRPPDHSTRP
jgi:TRAP-type transport system periplasmic protein